MPAVVATLSYDADVSDRAAAGAELGLDVGGWVGHLRRLLAPFAQGAGIPDTAPRELSVVG